MKKLQASELRIGNLVKHDGKIGAVCVIYEDAINFTDETSLVGWYTLEFDSETELKPIPLTEDWLLRMGFEISPDELQDSWEGVSWQYKIHDFYMLSNPVFYFAYNHDNHIEYFTDDAMEYVHQLQNLFYALVGEELTINAINETE